MKWIEANITTTADGVKQIEDILECCGISGWQVIDYEEMRAYLTNNPTKWDYIDEGVFAEDTGLVTVRFYTEDNRLGISMVEAVETVIEELRNSQTGNQFGPLTMTLEQTREDNWLDNWQKYYTPIEIGKKIIIIPDLDNEELRQKDKARCKVYS
jgi:ribosomal protein L11 methyltransferase